MALPAGSARANSNLLDNSPFLPPDAAAHAAQQTASLELRSILEEGGKYEFSLYDPARKQSTWVGLNEAGNSFSVKAFDAANNIVTVEQHSRTYTLALKEAKIVPLTMSPMMAAAATPSPSAEAFQQGIPEQAALTHRLALDEIRRRAQLGEARAAARLAELQRQASMTPAQADPARLPPSQN
jgi:hypothetical protein